MNSTITTQRQTYNNTHNNTTLCERLFHCVPDHLLPCSRRRSNCSGVPAFAPAACMLVRGSAALSLCAPPQRKDHSGLLGNCAKLHHGSCGADKPNLTGTWWLDRAHLLLPDSRS